MNDIVNRSVSAARDRSECVQTQEVPARKDVIREMNHGTTGD